MERTERDDHSGSGGLRFGHGQPQCHRYNEDVNGHVQPVERFGGQHDDGDGHPVAGGASGGLAVNLISSDTTHATVPASVTVAAGATTGRFTVTGVQDGLVNGNHSVTITAKPSSLDYASATADLNVIDTTGALAVAFNPLSVLEGGTVTGTITLSQAAPAGGLTVNLSSSDTTEATVPASVTIAAGATTGTFTVTGVQDGVVGGTKSVTITAKPSSVDYVSATGSLNVIDTTGTLTVTFNPLNVLEGSTATGTITLSQAAPTGGLTVNLTSSDTTHATVPASVTVAAGATTETFTVTGVQDGVVDDNQSVTITAKPSTLAYASATGNLNVIDTTGTLTVSFNPLNVLEGSTATGTITLSQAAPAGGLTVNLTSSDTTHATVPASVTVAAGATTGTFTVTGVQDGVVDDNQSVTITAKPSTLAYASGTGSLNVIDTTGTLAVSFNPLNVLEGSTATGTITLSQAAPAGGLTVNLTSSDTTHATVPRIGDHCGWGDHGHVHRYGCAGRGGRRQSERDDHGEAIDTGLRVGHGQPKRNRHNGDARGQLQPVKRSGG